MPVSLSFTTVLQITIIVIEINLHADCFLISDSSGGLTNLLYRESASLRTFSVSIYFEHIIVKFRINRSSRAGKFESVDEKKKKKLKKEE